MPNKQYICTSIILFIAFMIIFGVKTVEANDSSSGWTHTVETENGILYYNTLTGNGAVARIDSAGNRSTIKSYPSGTFATGWTHVENTSDGILWYNSQTGAATVGRIDGAGNYTAIKSYPAGSFSPTESLKSYLAGSFSIGVLILATAILIPLFLVWVHIQLVYRVFPKADWSHWLGTFILWLPLIISVVIFQAMPFPTVALRIFLTLVFGCFMAFVTIIFFAYYAAKLGGT